MANFVLSPRLTCRATRGVGDGHDYGTGAALGYSAASGNGLTLFNTTGDGFETCKTMLRTGQIDMQKANPMTEIAVANITLGNHQPMSLIGGMNVIESRDLVMRVAEAFVTATDELGLPHVFKASFDKANRSFIHFFRGPGLDEGTQGAARGQAQFWCACFDRYP